MRRLDKRSSRHAFKRAFPAVLDEAVTDVIARLPAADVSSHGFAVRVDREELVIPYRIHAEDVDTASVDGLAGIRSDVLACLYTRHHDGYVRQRSLRAIIERTHPWVAPFVVQLIGEYVVEILLDIQSGLSDLDVEGSDHRIQYGTFVRENAAFFDLTSQHVMSYWDCYYRASRSISTSPPLYSRSDYPGFELLASLSRAAASVSTPPSDK
jgi:hypothetical protein